MNEIVRLHSTFQQAISNVISLDQLEKLKITYLGRNGSVNNLFKKINQIPEKDRKIYGQKLNQLKTSINQLIEVTAQKILKEHPSKEYIDESLPGKSYPKGSLHPITYTIEEIAEIFQKIGFIRVSYQEVEWEYFSFEALNMPKGHPARDDFETFFINTPVNKKFGKMVLTPHTSSGQNREMKRTHKPPVRMINIAKCYRPNWDTTHTPMFHQFEGLCIDKDINISHLKGTIDYFVKSFFGKDRQIRLRPAHFQFTEPSFEVDVTCGVCYGLGYTTPHVIPSERRESRNLAKRKITLPKDRVKCKVCKSGWLELAGAGLVHPNVLKAGSIDPEVYSGWAFGFGPERCMMMKDEVKIDDIRILYNADVRFLEQF